MYVLGIRALGLGIIGLGSWDAQPELVQEKTTLPVTRRITVKHETIHYIYIILV